MTSWAWMEGIEVAVADPMSPVNKYDKRLAVKDLIVENRDQIDSVKSDLVANPLYDPNKHDDLWILRFIMSHKKKKGKRALKAIENTLAFRKEHKIDEWGDIRGKPAGIDCEHTKRLYEYFEEGTTFQNVLPDQKRGLVLFLRIGGIDAHALVKNVDESAWLPYFAYFTEFSHQWLDYITRTTGRLTKHLRIVDLKELTLSKISMEYNRRDGRAMGVMEDCYPQLLQRIYICNSSRWVQIPWRICKPLLPKRVVEKLDFINTSVTKERSGLLEFISEEHLPERYGGQNSTWPVEFDFPSTSDK